MIAYRINGGYSGLAQCYGSITSVMNLGHEVNKFKNDFTGLRLYFDEKAYNKDRGKTPQYVTFSCRELMADAVPRKDIWDTLQIARSVGFDKYLKKTNTEIIHKGYVDFDPSVPFIVVVALTGFFRWFDNHSNFLSVYRILHKKLWQKYDKIRESIDDEFTIPPATPRAVPLFLAANALSFGTAKTIRGMPQRRHTNLVAHGHSTHSVVPSAAFTLQGMHLFSTWPQRAHHLLSMGEEFKRTETLSYAGRDDFFCGAPPAYAIAGAPLYVAWPELAPSLNYAHVFVKHTNEPMEFRVKRARSLPIDVDRLTDFLIQCQFGEEEAPCLK
jgi:hypothetical protein